jgi:hypothetical protein
MFGWFNRSPQRPTGAPPRRVRLMVERLETRFCPAGPPVLSGLTAQTGPGHEVFISGQVQDDHPGDVAVKVTGVMQGTWWPNSNGYLFCDGAASSLGAVSVVGVDDQGLSSSVVTLQVTSNVPAITLNLAYSGKNLVTLSGTVTDEDPAGRTVVISGAAGATVTTDVQGNYSVTVPARLGVIRASTTDPWGQASNIAQQTATSLPPSIINFRATQGYNNLWTFQGQVNDESPAGLVVRLGGVPGLCTSAVVGSDGWFSLTVQLAPGVSGLATAQVTDWWGLAADIAYAPVTPGF